MYFVPYEGLMENNKEKQQKSSDLLKKVTVHHQRGTKMP